MENLPKEIGWEAPEYDHFERDSNWFWTMGTAGVIIALIGILFKNFLFAILILAGTFSLLVYGARIPAILSIILTPRGIKIGSQLYPYDRIQSFWISDKHGTRKIIFRIHRFLLPHLIVSLGENISDELARDYLVQYLPEEPQEESLTDVLFEYLGF